MGLRLRWCDVTEVRSRADKPLSTSVRVKIYFSACAINPYTSSLVFSLAFSPLCSCFSPLSHILFMCSLCTPKYVFLFLLILPPPILPIFHIHPHSPVSPPAFSASVVPACWASEGHFRVRDWGRGWCSYTHPVLRITAGWRRDGLMIRMLMWKERNWKDGERQNSAVSRWGHSVLVSGPLWLHQCMLLPFVFIRAPPSWSLLRISYILADWKDRRVSIEQH